MFYTSGPGNYGSIQSAQPQRPDRMIGSSATCNIVLPGRTQRCADQVECAT